jgi:hypothetical protein
MFFRPGQGATLLVVSSLGRRAPSRWVLGSVAGRTARHARVPVLVVRDAAPFVAWAADPRPLVAGVSRAPVVVMAAGRGARGRSHDELRSLSCHGCGQELSADPAGGDAGAAAARGQTYGRTRSPKSLIASMILSCGGPPE